MLLSPLSTRQLRKGELLNLPNSLMTLLRFTVGVRSNVLVYSKTVVVFSSIPRTASHISHRELDDEKWDSKRKDGHCSMRCCFRRLKSHINKSSMSRGRNQAPFWPHTQTVMADFRKYLCGVGLLGVLLTPATETDSDEVNCVTMFLISEAGKRLELSCGVSPRKIGLLLNCSLTYRRIPSASPPIYSPTRV